MIFKVDPLDAALQQQSATGSALCRASDFSTIDQDVCVHGFCEAITPGNRDGGSLCKPVTAGVNAPDYNCAFADSLQNST